MALAPGTFAFLGAGLSTGLLIDPLPYSAWREHAPGTAVLLAAGAFHGNRWLELPVLKVTGRISYALYFCTCRYSGHPVLGISASIANPP